MTATATRMVKAVWQSYFPSSSSGAGEEEEAAALVEGAEAAGVAQVVDEDVNAVSTRTAALPVSTRTAYHACCVVLWLIL